MFNFNNLIIDNNLTEINYGLAEGLDYEEYYKKYPNKILQWKQKKDPRFPKGENMKDVHKRIYKFINNRILINNFDQDINKILVVSHNVVIRCLIGNIFKININDWFKL